MAIIKALGVVFKWNAVAVPQCKSVDGPDESIDTVDTSKLVLGRISYAYVTVTNTGTVPITKTRIEITAGRDFGFPIGFQSRSSVQELYDHIGPGETHILANSFNLPRYEGIVSLEGLYQVTVKVYANDAYYIGEWKGEVFLRG